MTNNKLLGPMIILAVVLYCVSPIDLFPGPVDDVIVVLCGLAARKRIAAKSEA